MQYWDIYTLFLIHISPLNIRNAFPENIVYISGGTDSVHMMLADAVIILLCAILGYVYIRRIDILNTKEV